MSGIERAAPAHETGVAPDSPAVPRSRTPDIWILSALIIGAGLALFLVVNGPLVAEPQWSSWSGWVAMVALFALAEAFVIHIHLGRSAHTISLTDGVVLLSLLHVGHRPTVAAVVVGGCLTLRVFRRQPLIKVAFNAGTFVLCSQLAAFVLELGHVGAIDSIHAIGVGFAACLAFAVSGSLLVLVVVRVSGNVIVARDVLPSLGVSAAASLATAAVGMATAVLASSVPVAVPLMLVPFISAYLSNVVYQRERQRKGEMEFLHRSTEALRHAEATEHTLSALIANAQRDLHFSHVEVVLSVGGVQRRAQSPEHGGVTNADLLDSVAMPAPGTAAMRNASNLGEDDLSRVLLDRGLHSGFVVAVHVPGVVDGILLIGSEVEGVDVFDSRDLPLAFALAAQIGALVENERQMASISELRDLERRLVHELQHDPLTGLLNRPAFSRAVRHVLSATGADGERWAVGIIDLDDFKNVNDSFGHAAGDELLVTVARRIQTAVAPSELVARLSGDEFAVLFDPSLRNEQLHQRGRRVLDAIRTPMTLKGGVEVTPRASIGIGVTAVDDDLPALLDRADQAMYRAKARGKNAIDVIDPQQSASSGRHRDLVSQLTDDVPLEQLEMSYQPVIDATTGTIVSIEALLRWNHPVHGILSPNDFLIGSIEGATNETIDEFVLRNAADAIDASARFPDISIAINLGGTQISRDSFADVLRHQTTTADLRRLVLEVPVRALRRSPEATVRRLAALRELGVAIALDDLTLDEVPFALLTSVRPTIVKLARSTVAELSDPEVAPVVRAIADLGSSFGFRLVAKGIETTRQRMVAHDLGCTWMQGFGLRAPTTLAALLDDLGCAESEASIDAGHAV